MQSQKQLNRKTTTTRSSYFMHSTGFSILLISLCFLFGDNKLYAIPGIGLAIVCFYLSGKLQKRKPPKGVEFDENGNVKPQRL